MNPFEYIKDKLFGIDDLNISEDEKIEKLYYFFQQFVRQ